MKYVGYRLGAKVNINLPTSKEGFFFSKYHNRHLNRPSSLNCFRVRKNHWIARCSTLLQCLKEVQSRPIFLKGLLFTTTSAIKCLNCFDRCQVKKIPLVNSLIRWRFSEIKKTPTADNGNCTTFRKLYYHIVLRGLL